MNNDTVMYIAVAAAVLAVIALIMICQVRSSLSPQHRRQQLKRRRRQQLREPLIMVLL